MIEIIPNWHPILVHFTIGLLLTSAVLFVIAATWKLPAATTVARWNLWIGAAFAVVTVATGYAAYNSVAHDAESHVAMRTHLWWARGTLVLWLVAATLAWRERFRETGASPVLLAAILIASGTLCVTAYLGAENVYRHGIGVMRLPQTEQLLHGPTHDGQNVPPPGNSPVPERPSDPGDSHDHDHHDHAH